MADEVKDTKSENKPIDGVQKVTSGGGSSQSTTAVLPKVTKPIEVKQSIVKEVKKPVVKDPQGMFDYSDCQTYVVQSGDTLLDVAQKFAVALQQLRYFNHVDKAKMTVKKGKILYIPKKPIYVPYGE